jgi:hypothetical protein
MAGLQAMMASRSEQSTVSPFTPSATASYPGFSPQGASGAQAEAQVPPAQAPSPETPKAQAKPGASEQSEHPALEQASQWWGFLQKQFEQLASHASLGKALGADHAPDDANPSSASPDDALQPDQAGYSHQSTQAQDSGKAGELKQTRRQTRIPRPKTPSKAKPRASM